MPLPTKKYERVSCLQRLWQVELDDVYYAIENGLLKTAIWLPLRYVERGIIRNRRFIYEAQEHVEGFVCVRPEDSRQILSSGRAKPAGQRIAASTAEKRRAGEDPNACAIDERLLDIGSATRLPYG